MRYAFDNSMAKGPIALIGWLAVLSITVVVVAAVVVLIMGAGGDEDGPLGFVEAAWQSLMRTLDAGTMGGDVGWGFRAVMLAVTLGGIFVVSTLIGVLTTGIEGRMDELRKGRSVVVEHGHTLVLGWSPKVFTVLSELAVANANVKRPRIVVLADHDKVEMEDAIRARVGDALGRTKVICRSGSPMSPTDLAIGNPGAAKSIVVLPPEEGRADAHVLRALMAVASAEGRAPGSSHVVAALGERANIEVAELIAPGEIHVLHVGDLIARVTAQTCRQSGLSAVYTELLDFDGEEIYFQHEDALVGRTYADALLSYEDSAVIGIRRAATGAVDVNPRMDTTFAPGDEVVAISADDDTVRLATAPVAAPVEDAIVARDPAPAGAERTLVIGWNARGGPMVQQLDEYVAAGSVVDVVVDRDDLETEVAALALLVRNAALAVRTADATQRRVLEGLDPGGYDHVILLADDAAQDREDADTRTLVVLLHLRDLAARHGYGYSIVTEVLDSRNRQLARTTSADDFIVSDELVSLFLAQVSEHAALAQVLNGLFDADGSEIYLRAAGDYVALDRAVPFSTVVESARRRGETAIGYRVAAQAGDPDHGYGIVVNPAKSVQRTFVAGDRVIVLAED